MERQIEIVSKKLYLMKNAGGCHTVFEKRRHYIFDYNYRILKSIFSNFYTVRNRSEYSTITCNLLT